VLLIAGMWTRAAALVVAVTMVVAVALVHVGQLAQLTAPAAPRVAGTEAAGPNRTVSQVS
jgi:uncharacterized membrane protein YphA (DoxX/SURF4 family)